MNSVSPCPKCKSEYTYSDGTLFICPECTNEWNGEGSSQENEGRTIEVKDAHGNLLHDGDQVTVIKDLKVGGSAIKIGTKVKDIRLVDGPGGHNIDCKIKGFGAMMLKSEFVKKS